MPAQDRWLLRKLWTALRAPPAVPVVLRPCGSPYAADQGCIFLPADFEVDAFADLLEEELDSIREQRASLAASHRGDPG